jgi:hypothetical protein
MTLVVKFEGVLSALQAMSVLLESSAHTSALDPAYGHAHVAQTSPVASVSRARIWNFPPSLLASTKITQPV